MKMKRMQIAIFGMASTLLPLAAVGQMDPGTNIPPPGPAPSTAGTPVTSATMRDTLGAPGETGHQMADKQFLRAAAEGGTAEVKLGTLAVQKGGPEVKELGQKMIDDHTAINKDMASVADSLGVMLPRKISKDDQAEYDKLSGLSGDAFDKEYILYMVKDHRADMRSFIMEGTTASDPTLQSEVMKAAGMIRGHLMMLTKLAGDKGVTLPPRPPRPGGPPPPPPSN